MADSKAINTITDYMNDETRVNPADRERINFEVDLVGKMMETREEKGDTIDNTICRNLQDVTRS